MTSPRNKYINKLQGKRVLIFGGTSGIGFAVAEATVEYGGNIIITGSNQGRLDHTVERLTESYPHLKEDRDRITTHQCNLMGIETLEGNIEELFDAVTTQGSNKINHVVFTAGDSLPLHDFSEITLEDLSKASNIRILAPIFLLKHAPNYMPSSYLSSITFTGGTATDRPQPTWGLVGTMFAALEGLTRSAAVSLAPIRVNICSPGAIETEAFHKEIPAEAVNSVKEGTLLKKVGQPEDIAEVYLYCMKDTFATGTVYKSEGGRLLMQ